MFFKRWQNQELVNQKVNQKIGVLDQSLQDSFNKVKVDVQHVNQWINYLHNHQDRIDTSIHTIEQRFDRFLTKDELKYFVDEYYRNINTVNESVSAFKNEVNTHLNSVYTNQKLVFQRLEALSQGNLKQELQEEMRTFKHEMELKVSSQLTTAIPTQGIFDKLELLNRRLDEVQSNMGSLQEKANTRQNLKEKIFKKITRHSKDYVKSMLISLIKKYNKISGLNLREIVVEEQGIVSKSSFYRLLTEIEEDEGVNVVQEGKEKHYFWMLNSAPETN